MAISAATSCARHRGAHDGAPSDSGRSAPSLPRAVALAAAAALAAPAASDAAAARTIVTITERAPLHARPGGPVLQHGRDPLAESGSAWVVRRVPGWLGIPTAQRRDGALGWIRTSPLQRTTTTRLLVTVDLSQRRTRVTSGGRLLLSAAVTVGAPGSPSPVGSTSVSARLTVTPSSGMSRSDMGPVVVALRMWQPLASPGMPLGGVMAFHGGDQSSIGSARSGGCFRMRHAALLRLARIVRAGTPVVIRR